MRVKIVSEYKIHTEKPLDELWLQLRLFESEHYSKQFLKEKYSDIEDKELNKLSVILSSNIKQAYEYYYAASHVSILTSPLLYYYGMMCLSNVLWASLNKTDTIKESHGLYSNPEGMTHELSDEYVIVHKKGSFPALHSCFSDYSIEENTKFYIKDIFSVIPELKTLYEEIYNKKSRAMKLNINQFDRKDYPYFQEVLKNTGFFKQYNVSLWETLSDDITAINSPHDFELFGYPFQKNITGESFFILPLEFKKMLYGIPEASAHFMVMHCLGMLVRYEPVKWLQIVSGRLSSDINLINRFIDISKRKFPNIVLNGLLGKDMQFIMNNDNSSYINRNPYA